MSRDHLPVPKSPSQPEQLGGHRTHQISARELSLCSQRKARKLLSFRSAWRLKVLPLSVIRAGSGREYITVATAKELQHEDLQMLKFETGRELHIVKVTTEILEQAILETYRGDPEYLEKINERVTRQSRQYQGAQDLSVKRSAHLVSSAEEDPPDILIAVIEHAIALHCSDIHLKPDSQGEGQIFLRREGILQKVQTAPLDKRVLFQLTNRIKILAGCDISLRDRPQDGAFDMQLRESTRTLRISTLPTVYGEQVVLRLPGVQEIKSFHDLHLTQFARRALQQACLAGEGGIVLCGPTGSGKTTLLYSLVSELKSNQSNIITLEDPVESLIPGISQVAITHATSFATSLRAVMRQDPDVLLIGEIRDQESAQAAIQSTLTGHLLLTTLHARNFFEIFLRLKHFEISNIDLSQSLKVLLSLRLAPELCHRCKVVDLQSTRENGFKSYKAAGCACCEYTGYRGRVPVTETLILNRELKQALLTGKPLVDYFQSENYQSFYDSAREQIASGRLDHEKAHGFKKM